MALQPGQSSVSPRRAPIDGGGTQTRDFTYIDDVKRGNAQLLTDDSADGELMTVGATDNIDIKTLAEVVRDAIDPLNSPSGRPA